MSFKDKFLATRIAIENILFEKDVSYPRKIEKKYYLYLLCVVFLYFFINLYYFYSEQDTLRYFIQDFNFSKLTVKDILLDKLSRGFDMPMYYIIFKLFSYFFTITPWTVFVINILLSILAMIGFFRLVAVTRNESSAFLALLSLLSTPFFIEISRTPKPSILAFVCVVWTYYYYLKMKNEEQYTSVPYYLFFYSLGLLSDKFFLIYTLPCFSFTTFLFTTVYSNYVMLIFVPSALITLIFYIRFFLLYIVKFSFLEMSLNFFNLKGLLSEYIKSMGVFNSVIITPFFIWMLFAVYGVYVARKEIFAWFFYPSLFYLLIPISPEPIKFAVPAFIVGFSVMFFPSVRRYFIYFMIFFLFVSGSNIFSINLGKYPVWGYSPIGFYESRIVKNILYTLRDEKKNSVSNNIVSVNISGKNISSQSFETMKHNYGVESFKFVDIPPDLFPFSCYVITDKKTGGVKRFDEIFFYKGIYLLKNPWCLKESQKDVSIKGFSSKELTISDMRMVYDTLKKTTSVDIAYLGYKGIDSYGLKLEIKDTKIKIINAIISQYSLERFFEELMKKNTEVILLDDLISVKRSFFVGEIVFDFYPDVKDGCLNINFVKIKIAFIEIGRFLSNFISFKIPFDLLPLPVEFSKMVIKKGIVKIT